MCGVVGYIGKQEAVPLLIDGLKKLEYRGYDSSGIAIHHGENGIDVTRSVGGVSELVEALGKKVKNDFLNSTPALKVLRERVVRASEKGYIKGLDGNGAPIRGGKDIRIGDWVQVYRAGDVIPKINDIDL